MKGGFRPPVDEAVYALLVDVAKDGLPCPKNEEIGNAVGCQAQSVGRVLRRLADRGRIRVEMVTHALREVTILATGHQTATSNGRRVPPQYTERPLRCPDEWPVPVTYLDHPRAHTAGLYVRFRGAGQGEII